MKHTLTIGLTAIALLAPVTGAFAQQASENAYGGSGQVPAVLGVTESNGGGDDAGGGANGVNGVTEQSGTAGVTATGAVPTANATAPTAVPTGSLPFTGLDLALIALGGLALVGVGFGMRRLGRPAAEI